MSESKASSLVQIPYPQVLCSMPPYADKAKASSLTPKDHDPVGWARAVEIDIALRNPDSVVNRDMKQTMYLHRTCQPLTQITFRPRENTKELQLGFAVDSNEAADAAGFGVECEGVCGV